MEILLTALCIILSLCLLLDKAIDLIKQLKTKKSVRLKHGFEAKISIAPIDEKKEACATHKTSNSTTE